ncbi:MAG: hypothetical protein HC844_17230, partial [Tabrizicola sp.]|nr:hypothetical protein [Tabrizicola sp.]
MTALSRSRGRPGRLSRLGSLILDGVVGTLLTLLPVTSLLALGWLTRRA